MTTTDLLLIYIMTTQIMWLITFMIWEIKPLKPIREPLLLISLFIATPPVAIIMVIGHLIDRLVDRLKDKKRKPTPDTHEVRQDDETGLTLYSANDYNVGDLVYVDDEQYRILSTPHPENGVMGYRVKRLEEENETEKTK